MDGLEEERGEEEAGRLAGHAEEVAQVAGKERAVEDDVAGREGVGRDAGLDVEEEGKEERGEREADNGEVVGPAAVGARVEAGEETDDGGDEEEGAEEIDAGDLFAPVGVVCLW